MIPETINILRSLSTPVISDALDALGINGWLQHIRAINTKQMLIGPAFTIRYEPFSQQQGIYSQASNYIDDVPQNSVIVIDNQGHQSCSVWGGLLSQCAQRNGLAGTVIHGMARDKLVLELSAYKVFASGVTPVSGKNRVRMVSQQCTLNINAVTINPNDIIMADQNGVLVLPKKQLANILAMAENIQKNEGYILQALHNGETLASARAQFHYEKPWEQ